MIIDLNISLYYCSTRIHGIAVRSERRPDEMLRELLRDVRRVRGDEEQAPKCNLATPNDATGKEDVN